MGPWSESQRVAGERTGGRTGGFDPKRDSSSYISVDLDVNGDFWVLTVRESGNSCFATFGRKEDGVPHVEDNIFRSKVNSLVDVEHGILVEVDFHWGISAVHDDCTPESGRSRHRG
jgi:hypothetical protein